MIILSVYGIIYFKVLFHCWYTFLLSFTCLHFFPKHCVVTWTNYFLSMTLVFFVLWTNVHFVFQILQFFEKVTNLPISLVIKNTTPIFFFDYINAHTNSNIVQWVSVFYRFFCFVISTFWVPNCLVCILFVQCHYSHHYLFII